LTTICNSISSQTQNYNTRNKGLHQQILNIKHEGENICFHTQVEFSRKYKKYKKFIYFL